MRSFAQLVTRRPWAALLLLAGLAALSLVKLPLGYDDDVVRFLPASDPEVAAFDRLSERFGSLDVALVAVDSPDLFTPERLAYVRALSQRLERLPEVSHVTSMTELSVVRAGDDGEAHHVPLVPRALPHTAEALAALRAEVLALDYLTGVLVSEDGGAAVLIAQLRTTLLDGSTISSKHAAERVKATAAALAAPPDTELLYGGAPFIAEAAANGSQDDLARLAPFVVGITLLLVILSLGSLAAAFFTVLAVGLAIVLTMGLMAWLGAPLTLVSTSLPVLLVALGSAYAVHLLVWYRERGADAVDTLTNMGWPIVITALTTAAGFLSFVVMDLGPMREFGWQMAAGTTIAAGVALTLIPALLTLQPIPARPVEAGAIDRWLVRVAVACRRRRVWVLAIAGVAAVVLSTQLTAIDTRMNTAAFFEQGSAPARADDLLADKFGGSVFLQVLVDGDMRDPAVLDRLAAFEDRLAALPGVTRSESIAKVLAIVHEGLKERRRLSRSRAEVEQLGFLARQSDPAVALLVDDRWQGAVIQVGIGAFDTGVVDRITGDVRALAAEHLSGRPTFAPRSEALAPAVIRDAAERLVAIAGAPVDAVAPVKAILGAGPSTDTRAAVTRAVRAVFEREVVEDEMVALADPEAWAPLADRVAAGLMDATMDKGAFVAALVPLVDPAELDERAAFEKGARYVFTKLELAAAPLLAADALARLAPQLGDLPPRVRHRAAAIVASLAQPRWVVMAADPAAASAPPLQVTVSGQPVLQEAMTRSVQRNQALSISVSLPLVFLILWAVFKSPLAGLFGVLPAGLTLLVTFGLMGLFPERLPMDIAASMLASIALGVGIDYAIHFMWRYRRGGLEAAMRTTGRSIVINAVEITGGFIVLAWATIAPLSRFGLLTAVTLSVAAAATLVLLPALLSGWHPPEDEAPAPQQGHGENEWSLPLDVAPARASRSPRPPSS
ncbi:MAG: hypothetical protein CSA66_04805 [Proteobacteria bacterium]|nr:MAG: hypothetical protein CSA66_04805 [Pseudomonadota bacterium]